MTENPSRIKDFELPLIKSLARAIKENPGRPISMEFDNQHLNGVMTEFIRAMLVKFDGLQINPNLSTRIADQKGSISGNVQVTHPLAGTSTVSLNIQLGNNPDKKTLQVIQRNVDASAISMRAKIAASASGINIEEKVNEGFGNINFLIFSGFRDQLKFQGVNLKNMEASFTPDKLNLVFIS